jgi:hypothetical protein
MSECFTTLQPSNFSTFQLKFIKSIIKRSSFTIAFWGMIDLVNE